MQFESMQHPTSQLVFYKFLTWGYITVQINLWYLLTPQEQEILEVLRPNTDYAAREFCVYMCEVCTR